MRIPLDYYRILGLPIQASAEQLQQAYRDRTLQLPRREYSDAAIAARRQLIEEASAILSDPKQRNRYDSSYLAHTYEPEAQNSQRDQAEERLGKAHGEAQDSMLPSVLVSALGEHYTPSIEISDKHFVGALLILQELGEYEIVLQLSRPYVGDFKSVSLSNRGQKSEPNQVLSDIFLTFALACLELGREQWQQGQYENAATSLETGQKLLLREGLFPGIQGEIQTELYKLRPYRILELLARPEKNVAERRQGLKLLQNILQERDGIDGTGDDRSGLSMDDFLRFIQQLRSYLTAAEQQSLFEAESQRPSAVATYLAVYALIARGFAQRMPVLVRRAKLLLMRLGRHQDLYLEQAVCSLLLGQTEAASRALELSQEYEPLAFIREHSQGSPDLLPGLCLYSENWLQTEVLPQFRDLKTQQQALLKDYFADEQVQAYLEALPTDFETTNSFSAVGPQLSQSRDRSLPSQPVQNTSRGMHPPSHRTAVVGPATLSEPTKPSLTTASADLAMVPASVRTAIATALPKANSPDATALVQVELAPQRLRRRRRSQVADSLSKASVLPALGKPLVMLVVGGVLGIVVLGFVVSQTYGWLRKTKAPAPSLQVKQSTVQLNQLPSPIPNPSTQLLPVEKLLTEETALEVIQTWLSTKAAAFGSDHAIDRLNQILVGPALSQWQRLAQNYKADNQYRQYKHSVKVDSLETSKATPNQAQVEATVNEVAKFYENGKLNQRASYDQNLRVRYNLVRKDEEWRIQEMTLLK